MAIPITPGTGRLVSTEQSVTSVNGTTVTAEDTQRVIPTTKTASGTVVDEAAGAGATTASTKRMTLASDDPLVAAAGAKADSAAMNSTSAWSLVALLKGLYALLSGTLSVSGSVSVPGGVEVSNDAGSPLPVSGTVGVASNAYTSQPTVTRPANTTAYTAGDVVGGAITFASVGSSGGHVLITSADLRIDVAAVPSGMTSFRLHLYDVTPPSALADNAAWDLPSGDRASYLGYLDLGTPADIGSTLYTQALSPGLQVKLASASTSLFGYLQTIGAFTPAGNSEVYAPRLRTVGV